MHKGSWGPIFTGIPLDAGSDVPLYRQLYEAVRKAILFGSLKAGARLPATRVLATELGVSRTTVLLAFELLLAEGYVEGRLGSGTYVNPALPEHLVNGAPEEGSPLRPERRRPPLSGRGKEFARARTTVVKESDLPRPFQIGFPALDAFPYKLWRRLLGRQWRAQPAALLGFGEPAGYRPLREAIAGYVNAARGVQCSADQVIVTATSQRAIELVAQLLLDPGDFAWVEDPCYFGARGALLSAGVRLVPIPVDADGLDVAKGKARCPAARLAYVTPSYQSPLGVTMSLARRLALLEWARSSGAWVLEDDYDSEYRYAGPPLPSLQGLDRHGRVLYVSNFSKVLYPSLRITYLIVPPDLVDAFLAARTLVDWHPTSVDQAVVADFIAQGHFAHHLRCMRALYLERQAALVAAAESELTGLLDLHPSEAGMHLVGWLPSGVNDRTASAQAAAHGVAAAALSDYYMRPPKRGGLVLGYAAHQPSEIRDGVRRLATALRSARAIDFTGC
jgi:GntR family transcriptional regulator/MocR family aminotransferase